MMKKELSSKVYKSANIVVYEGLFWKLCKSTESCFRHPLFDLRGTRKLEIRHTNF